MAVALDKQYEEADGSIVQYLLETMAVYGIRPGIPVQRL